MSKPNVIYVGSKANLEDFAGKKVQKQISEDLGISIDEVRVVHAYSIDMGLSEEELKELRENLFTDPVIQVSSINDYLPGTFDWLIEVSFKPGVTDNFGNTATKAISQIIQRDFPESEKVYSSKHYLLKSATLTAEKARYIAENLLANELIENIEIMNYNQVQEGLKPKISKVKGIHRSKVEEILLPINNPDLLKKISKDRQLALNLEEMKTIAKHFQYPMIIEERQRWGLGEKITDVELEVLAQTWSEHCKHKIFNANISYLDKTTNTSQEIDSLFKTYIQGSTEAIRDSGFPYLVSIFKDNAGVAKFNQEWNFILKVETHNAPSALDPYGGAITGIVGVNRDPMGTGLGGQLIFNTDVFCFASPFYDKELPPRILHPRRVLKGVRKGVEDGGNQSGIPTISGGLYFNDCFLGKPLVYVGTCGIQPAKIQGQPTHVKKIQPGDLIVMTGGRVGKDGIHGATFSSEELHEGSPVSAVQIGDPITQKIMYDFILEARARGYYRALTDNGAGGLSSSVGEMAQLSGGFELDLAKVPLKYAGLDPWEIMVSESQERMSLALKPEHKQEFLALAAKRGVEATILGKFTDSGKFHVKYGDKTVAFVDMEFIHDGIPQMQLKAVWAPPTVLDKQIPPIKDLGDILTRLLSQLNICSREWIIRQYDHEVQGGSTIKPLVGPSMDGPSDASVVRPILASQEGLIVSHGLNPNFSDWDTYYMALAVVDEAIRNIICVGGSLDLIVLNDNFCWPSPLYDEKTNPDGHYKLAQLVRANQGLYDATTAFGTPCISGKDSMSIDYRIKDKKGKEHKISGQPALLITAVGKIEDINKTVTMDFKKAGDLIYILGQTRSNELGGSEYFSMQGYQSSEVPKVNLEKAKQQYRSLEKAIKQELVKSTHDCSEGGLGVALAESAFAGELGGKIDLTRVPVEGSSRADYVLFSESASRIILTVDPNNKEKLERLLEGTDFAQIGEVTIEPKLVITDDQGQELMKKDIFELKTTWKKTLRW
ncbi:MAG: phosphoribosylformylglycinamidine synthase subunit PurS [Candidatus Hermodarchaeota archaeon]